MTTKQQKINKREEAREELKRLIKKGDTIYTVLTHVSSSGMSRRFKVLMVDSDPEFMPVIRDISWLVAEACDFRKGKSYDITIGGCGMDMAHHLVYQLSSCLGYRTGKPDGTTNCYGLNHSHL